MSLYNMLMGYNPACLLVMPMLGRQQSDYPRFRDCHINSFNTREIHIFTRVGSYNQNCGYGEEKLYEDPNYLRFEDDDFDPTYGTYIFKCPEEWETDFDAISQNRYAALSEVYFEMQRKFWGNKGDDIVAAIKGLAAKLTKAKEEEAK